MPCDIKKDDDGRVTMISCSRGGRKTCQTPGCSETSVALCDFKMPHGTCDRRMCRTHRTPVGFNLDHCPIHKEEKVGK